MKEAIDGIIEFLKFQVQANNPIMGVIIGMLVIVLESMLPVLPLAVFIAVNMLVFGNIIGFIISWIATIIGCILAFTICRKKLSNGFYNRIKKDGKINNLMNKISNIKFPNLVIITALPFTPAFAVNIATYIGIQKAGIIGAVASTFGVVMPSFIIILIVATAFEKFKENKYVKCVMSGLKPAVIGLIGSAVLSIGETAFLPGEGQNFSLPALISSICIFAVAAVLMFWKKLHPIVVIGISALLGICLGYAGVIPV